ncbi:MAG: hypothetical protein ACM3KF_03380 [Acidobacteriota bacterium]
MRKRFSLVAATLLALLTGPVVYAEPQGIYLLSDDNLNAIKLNCHAVQSTLTRIHTNDALSRVHLGQEYETISTKFMAPMNSRVALMKLNGVELAKTTVEFNDNLNIFRSRYQQYEQLLLKTLQLKCTDQPVAFYDAIVEARDARALVKEKVDELGKLVTQYSNQVKELRTAALSAEQQAEANT